MLTRQARRDRNDEKGEEEEFKSTALPRPNCPRRNVFVVVVLARETGQYVGSSSILFPPYMRVRTQAAQHHFSVRGRGKMSCTHTVFRE